MHRVVDVAACELRKDLEIGAHVVADRRIQRAFKRGGALSVLYPLYASTFIWAALLALAAYGTPIKLVNIAGMLLLVFGMFLMGK